MEYVLIFISAIFVNNIILSQFLGICPFLGVSKKVDTSLGMSAAVAFVLTLATIVTWCVQKFVLDAFGLQYLQTIAFILVIASLVQMVEIILKKVSPALYQALGIFLPLITTNCAVLGVAILVIQKDFNLLQSVVYAFSTAIGFAWASRGLTAACASSLVSNKTSGWGRTPSVCPTHLLLFILESFLAHARRLSCYTRKPPLLYPEASLAIP